MTEIPLTDQVREALAAFDAASIQAEQAAAAYGELKRLVGANESERKAQKASVPAEDYAGYVLHLAQAETEYKAAAAHLERVEKALNVLREMLNSETAIVARAAAVTFLQGSEKLHQTVDAYTRTFGATLITSDIRARLPRRIPVPAGDVPEEELPF